MNRFNLHVNCLQYVQIWIQTPPESQPLLYRLRGAFASMGRVLRRGKAGRGGAEAGEGGFLGAGGIEDKAPLRGEGDAPRSRAMTETSTSLLTLSPSFDALDMSYSTTNFTLAANTGELDVSFLFSKQTGLIQAEREKRRGLPGDLWEHWKLLIWNVITQWRYAEGRLVIYPEAWVPLLGQVDMDNCCPKILEITYNLRWRLTRGKRWSKAKII